MSNETGAPQGNPGDIVNWPMLKVVYRTDPAKIAALLPPGIEPGANPNVNLTIYNFPVPDEPEFGIVTTVDADYNGIAGEYTLGYGIDQESAIFVSQETNGQPKYPVKLISGGWVHRCRRSAPIRAIPLLNSRVCLMVTINRRMILTSTSGGSSRHALSVWVARLPALIFRPMLFMCAAAMALPGAKKCRVN